MFDDISFPYQLVKLEWFFFLFLQKYNQSEQAYDEVQSKLKEVSNMKLVLEQEKIRLQSDLSIATSQQRDDIYHKEELQGLLHFLVLVIVALC